MRFSIDTASLKRAIGIVARTAFNKGVEQSILECIHIKADEDEVIFRTYNSVTATRCSVNADVSSPGEAALPARVLSDVVNKLFADTTTFDTEESSFTTVVSSGKARLSLQGPDPEGFPSPDFNSDGAETILIEDQTQLRTLIDGTSFAASQDEDKPVYTGLLLQGEGDRLSMIGIDGVRIAKRSIMMEASSDIYEIIPSRTLKDISRLLDEQLVHPDDADEFRSIMALDQLRLRMFHEKGSVIYRFRRKFKAGYFWTSLELFPDTECSKENPWVVMVIHKSPSVNPDL